MKGREREKRKAKNRFCALFASFTIYLFDSITDISFKSSTKWKFCRNIARGYVFVFANDATLSFAEERKKKRKKPKKTFRFVAFSILDRSDSVRFQFYFFPFLHSNEFAGTSMMSNDIVTSSSSSFFKSPEYGRKYQNQKIKSFSYAFTQVKLFIFEKAIYEVPYGSHIDFHLDVQLNLKLNLNDSWNTWTL